MNKKRDVKHGTIASSTSTVNQLTMPLVLSDDDGIRPVGGPDKCTYCQQKVGEPHKHDCVILKKKVRLKYSFEVEVEMPYSWDESQILFNRNDGSWCADNALDELAKAKEEIGCLCGVFEAEIVSMSDAPPFRKNDAGEIVV